VQDIPERGGIAPDVGKLFPWGRGDELTLQQYNLLFTSLFAVICECILELVSCHSCYFHGKVCSWQYYL
jgi:hypothetical protein